jgi:hypothetical protein
VRENYSLSNLSVEMNDPGSVSIVGGVGGTSHYEERIAKGNIRTCSCEIGRRSLFVDLKGLQVSLFAARYHDLAERRCKDIILR